jgi:hypothetical protein
VIKKGIELDESRCRAPQFHARMAPEAHFDREASSPQLLDGRDMIGITRDEGNRVLWLHALEGILNHLDCYLRVDLFLPVSRVPLVNDDLKTTSASY